MYDTPAQGFGGGSHQPPKQRPVAPAPEPSTGAAPGEQPVPNVAYEQREVLLQFARETSDTFLFDCGRYIELLETLEAMMNGVASVTQADDLMQLRRTANSIAEGQAVLSRTVGDLRETYRSYGLEADNPIILRPLMQEIGESCVLIANTASITDMADLPLYDPDALIDALGEGRLHAWLLAHARPQTPQLPAAAQPEPQRPAPSQQPTAAAPAASPYPTAEADDPAVGGFPSPPQPQPQPTPPTPIWPPSVSPPAS